MGHLDHRTPCPGPCSITKLHGTCQNKIDAAVHGVWWGTNNIANFLLKSFLFFLRARKVMTILVSHPAAATATVTVVAAIAAAVRSCSYRCYSWHRCSRHVVLCCFLLHCIAWCCDGGCSSVRCRLVLHCGVVSNCLGWRSADRGKCGPFVAPYTRYVEVRAGSVSDTRYIPRQMASQWSFLTHERLLEWSPNEMFLRPYSRY